MLDPASWTHYCKEVQRGRKVYRDHDCGAGRTLLVSHSDKGFSAWCFRCSDGGYSPHPEPDMATRLAQLSAQTRADNAATVGAVRLPVGSDDPRSWPLYAKVWLYKVGIGNPEITKLGALYSERMDRVVVPVYEGGELVYWQARGFSKGRPKYINPDVDKRLVIPSYGTGITVLTEDLLSAFRVGNVAKGVSLLGTTITEKLFSVLTTDRQPVLVWLDPDAAGQRAANKALTLLRRWGIPCARVQSELDPKLLSRDAISAAIEAALPDIR